MKKRVERKRLENIAALEEDAHPEKMGVLLSDEIEFYVEQGDLIKPFDPENLKPAAYELTVGDEAMLGGKPHRLNDCWPKNSLSIPAFEVAVIKTGETLNLPRFLIGRWNIRVAWAYKGLIWVGGPQVDPGYVGHLFCPIYNLSNKEVRIEKGDPIAVIDFVKTTKFDLERANNKKLLRYRRPPKRVTIEGFGIGDFRSGLFETKDKLDGVDTKINLFTTLVFVVLAILVSAVGIPYLKLFESEVENIQSDIRILDVLTLSFSLFAVGFSFFRWRSSPRTKPYALLTIIAALVVLAAITICVVSIIYPALSALGMYLMDCCSS